MAPETILLELFRTHVPRIIETYPGVTVGQAGEAEERARAISGLVSSSLVALMVIYTLLAVPLKSYLQPLVVMASIPFGFKRQTTSFAVTSAAKY